MEAQADSINTNGVQVSFPDFVPKPEKPLLDDLLDVKLEIEENPIFNEPEPVQIKFEEEKDDFLNGLHDLETQDKIIQENAMQILGFNDACLNEDEDVLDYESAFKKFAQEKSLEPDPRLLCPECDYYTFQPGHLMNHVLRHKMGQIPKKRNSTKKPKIKEPKKIKAPKIPKEPEILTCEVCNYKTLHVGHFRKHVLYHNREPQIFKCEKCEYVTNKKRYLKLHSRRHKKEIPTEPQIFRCELCSYQTLLKGRLKSHVLRHETEKDFHEPKFYECDECDYVSDRKGNLKLHSVRHKKDGPQHNAHSEGNVLKLEETKSEDVKMLECPDCSYKTFKTGHFRFHTLRHFSKKVLGNNPQATDTTKTEKEEGPKEPQVFSCKICDFQTYNKSSLYQHLRRHKDDPNISPGHFLLQVTYKCKDCSFQTTNRGKLYRHNMIHREIHKEPKEIFKCGFCDYQSCCRHNFKSHLKSHSFNLTEDDLFKCNECSFQTIRKVSLRVHMTQYHKGKEVVMNKCEDCSYESLHRNDFKKHLLIHKSPEELNMFKCSQCLYTTVYRGNLNTHIIRHHKKDNEIEMFRCYNCAYQTRFKSHLKEHMVRHTKSNSQEMLKCPDCDHQTAFKKNLSRHIRRYHNTNESYAEVLSELPL